MDSVRICRIHPHNRTSPDHQKLNYQNNTNSKTKSSVIIVLCFYNHREVGNNCNSRVCNRANAKQVTIRTHLSKVVTGINLTNFLPCLGIEPRLSLQGDLGVHVLVVYLKQAETP